MKIASSFSPAIIALIQRISVSKKKIIFLIIIRYTWLFPGSLNYSQHTHIVSEWHVWR